MHNEPQYEMPEGCTVETLALIKHFALEADSTNVLSNAEAAFTAFSILAELNDLSAKSIEMFFDTY